LLHPVTAEFRRQEYTKMAKLLNWTTVLLILALIVAIAGVSFLSMSTQWLVIILIALALVSIVIMGQHRHWPFGL
jgi:phosphatidylglycerophosphate synthase